MLGERRSREARQDVLLQHLHGSRLPQYGTGTGMRSSETSGSMGRDSRRGLWLALKLSAVALGIGLVMSAGPVRAGDDDDDDDMTFEEKLIDNLMSGLGAKGMEKKGIEYRERSPLVVPPEPRPAAARQCRRRERTELAEGSRREAPQGGHRRAQEGGQQGRAISERCAAAVASRVGRPQDGPAAGQQ
ncbi:hypothetical protein ACVWZ4_003482 [Bradyrhizobium sp. USDA 4472]